MKKFEVRSAVNERGHKTQAVFEVGDDTQLFTGWNAEAARNEFNRVGHGPLTKAEYIDAVEAPEGFTKTVEDVRFGTYVSVDLVFKSDTVEVKFHLGEKDKEEWNDYAHDGSTNYKSHGNWFTFDRRGHDSSFWDDMYVDPQGILDEQILRAWETIEERAKTTYHEVPGTTFTISKERRESISKNLKAGKTDQLIPAAMGTGLALSVRKVDRWSEPNLKLAKFFEVPMLWVDRLDCD